METAPTFAEIGSAPEQLLVQRCLAGEMLAWRQLHRRYFAIAQSFLVRMGVPASELEDTCQEVFLQLFRSLAGFRGEASLKTFLYRVCMTHAGRQRRRALLLASVRQLLLLEPSRLHVAPSEVSQEALERRLQAALQRLNPGQRAAFILFEFDGLDGKDIARILDCPESTVWRRLHEARRLVRSGVEERGGMGGGC